MQDASDGSATNQIVVEVGITEGRSDDALAKWGRSVNRGLFLGTAVAGILPAVLGVFETAVVRFISPDTDHTVAHLAEVTEDTLDTIHMSNSWGSSKMRKRHDCRTHIKSPNLDRPLQLLEDDFWSCTTEL